MFESIVLRISQNAKEYPEHVTIIDQGKDNFFTYRQFDDYARRVAAKLIRLGVGRRDFVTIELPRNKAYIAAMYGVWLAGAAFAPLSPTYPPERLEYIRRDCNARAVINAKFLSGIESEAPAEAVVDPEPRDPSLLIYTSGSTGKPKGVLHSHASICDSVIRYANAFDASEVRRVSISAPFTFVASVQGVFAPLYSRLTAVLMPYEAMRDPVLLADFIEENQVNRVFISPKMLKVFRNRSACLKCVVTGSERVSGIWSDQYDIVVCYGQSESAGAAMLFRLDQKYDNSPIGRPIGDIATYILDENGNEAEEGELCLAGLFADGYLNLPEQTAQTFTPNPFKDRDGHERLLRTGDIVRRNGDGNIVYLNRRDWMIKINGQRVEPGEIEAVIRNCPGIADAAVKDFKNTYGQVYIAAYYVSNGEADEDELKQAIGEKLPPYMLPSFFIPMDKLPMNANGKLDRSALIAPEAGSFKSVYVAPETDMQRALCAAFEHVLGTENVGVEDDFFALGGDSIKCAMAAAECDRWQIPVSVFFEGKTPRMIERLMIKRAQKKTSRRSSGRPTVYPLTPSERGMYLEQKLKETSTVYNLNIAVTVRGRSVEAVKGALNTVFSAHEAFHSRYGEKNGLPVRIVEDRLPEIMVEKAASREEVLARVDGYAIPFDLNAEIPVRPTLYQLPDGGVVLHLAIHHIAFDGGSARPFVSEFIDALNGKAVKAAPVDLSDLYEDSLNEKHSDGMAFYRKMFSDGVPVNEMPLKGSRPRVHPLSDRQINFEYDNEQLKAIDNAARRYVMTEFELIFAAVSMTLAKYTSSEDVVLGIPTNMRPGGAEDVIGMFVNTAPVRVKPARDMALTEYLRSAVDAIRATTYGASLPFEDVVAEFVKQRDESRNPIFDVSVNYMWNPPAYNQDGLSVALYAPLQRMSRDIGFTFRKSEKGLLCMVQYASELFEDEVIENFIGQLRNTLALIGRETPATVRDALALPEDQRAQLDVFGTTATEAPSETLLHRFFEHSVEAHPDHIALIARDATLTYRELNERANIVAHNLIARGMRTGDSVALLLPRESCFFACMFGVNKAGAAFIPCDPQYPADRINHIIEDSEASFIITTQDKLADYPADKAIDVSEILIGDQTENPDVEMDGEALSYMIYTSGSTGKPKGVMLRHKGICNYLLPHPANPHMHYIRENISAYLSVTTVSFDMSFKEHTAALCNGKTLIFAAEDEMNDPRALARLMDQYGVDCFNATPSRLQQYMDFAPFRNALSRCKLVMSGGEGYPMALRDAIRACSEDIQIINTYGPTEITVSCNAADLTHADAVTVGRPLLNYHEVIVDRFGDPAPYGVIGELYIGGIGVARGYKNLPDKTAAAFVEYGGARMYRSGDYAKWDSKGNVHILGRLDNQVKLRGLRIELGEIEGLIAAQPHMKKVAVSIRKLGGQDNLCAYFTADAEIDINALRDELKKHLTHYMVPTAYLQLNEMPMTANGKTDVKRLPDPVPVSLGEYVAPANATEEFFCEAFKKALDLERVGATDNFFEIGGTSLIVTSVVLAASEKGYEITYGDMFKNTTPRALAALFQKEADAPAQSLFDFDAIDTAKIDEMLARNTIASFREGELRSLGNILLTGATGYMGAHLLAQYLDEEEGMAWCMVRKGRHSDATRRLKHMMFYYFGSHYSDVIDARVRVIDGNVTDYACFEALEGMPIDTVFNCAANVKHFSSGTDIEDINVGGARNCVRFCKKTGATLIHFSTISVSGTATEKNHLTRTVLDEQSLYFGQTLDNKYTASKLMSEITVLGAAAEGEIQAKVIRVGTLAARESDGEFQINFLTNSFMGRLRAYNLLGCFPYTMLESPVCMGPIDISCRAFLQLARTPAACCLFNAANNHTLPYGDIIRRMNHNGMNIRFVEQEAFAAAMTEAQKDPNKAAILQSLIAYTGHAHGSHAVPLPFTTHYTTQVLARMGFFWNPGNERYIDGFINVLRDFTFFSQNNLER